MATVPTVKIVDPQKPGDYIIINAADYDFNKHTLAEGEILPNIPLFDERRKKNASAYFEACKHESRLQHETNREYSIKASGLLMFGITALGVATTFTEPSDWGVVACWLVAIQGIVLAVMSYFAMQILMPKTWKGPFNIPELKASLAHYEPDSLLTGMANGYAKAIKKNKDEVLDPKGEALKRLTAAAAIELVAFLVFLLCPLWSLLPV